MVPAGVESKPNPGAVAAKQALADRIAELGAVPLRDAAVARGIDPDMAGKWAKLGLSTSAFRGHRNVWCVREAEFDTELKQRWRCTWALDGERCPRYALNTSRRCHDHAGAIERDGRLTAEDFAVKHTLNLGQLLAHLKVGEIPAERVERGGRPEAWLIDEPSALKVLDEHFRCQGQGCPRNALEPESRYCGRCSRRRNQPVAAAAARKIWRDARRSARWVGARHGARAAARAFGRLGGHPEGSTLAGNLVAEILQRAASGDPERTIASETDTSRSQVRLVLKKHRHPGPGALGL